MLKPPVDVFVAGKALVDLKEIVVNACIENARSEGSSLTVAERKGGATFFYKYAELNPARVEGDGRSIRVSL
ncbi:MULTISPECIES: hypothetical protein [unclassified Caballeronia]|uniref:hypothetical protein n=1 Tax=unclassified Caballeronia TaxID=2646786 RepID=UPI00285A15C7|nr:MULTISPECIES: hypothetical protein [unclassified Caballeronia]MDR5755255.1 hypothetical protein [Caballeronia sp. LZ024]MDR5845374.1 hypothetical protein [Caballeronia sp. LZ031]